MKEKEKESDKASSGLPEMPNLPPMPLSANMSNEVSTEIDYPEGHRAGFVNIVGSPNVGKSTLMNKLVGENISIINSKAQTTRHRIMGIVNQTDWQIVYSDTPGVLDPAYKLQEGMMKFVKTALQDADVLILVTDVYENSIAHEATFEKISKMEIPIFILINKQTLWISVSKTINFITAIRNIDL